MEKKISNGYTKEYTELKHKYPFKKQNNMNKKITLTLSSLALGISVHAQTDSTRVAELNPVVITGTGTYRKADNSPMAVRVISAKDIKDVQATSLQDALSKLTPNITTHTNGMGTFVNFNGTSDDYLLILHNGKRVSGDDRWQRISLDNIKRIEIFSGAASALYGSDAIAGVINIITDDSYNGLSASSHTKVMSKGRLDQDINMDINTGKFSSYTSYSHRQADNWQVNKYQEFIEVDAQGEEHSVLKLNGRPMSQAFTSHHISEKMEWTFNDQWSMYVIGDYYDHNTERPRNALTYSQKKDKKTGEYTYSTKSSYTYDLHHTSYKYGGGARWAPNNNTHIYLDIYSDNYKSEYSYWQTADKEAYDETRKRTHYTNETLKGIFRLADWNKLSGGIEFIQESLNSESDNIDFETTNSYNFFAQDEIKIVKGLEAVAGVRYTYNDNFGSHFTPNIGLFYRIGGFRARAGYAGGYRTPSLSQLYATDQAKTSSRYTINNTSLKPETNQFCNINLEYGNKWMVVSVTGFHNKIKDMINYRTMTKDEIEADPHLTALNAEWSTIRQRDNIDQATLQGVSTNLKFILPFGLTIGGGYTFTDAKSKTKTLDSKTQTYIITESSVDKSVRHVGNINMAYDKTWNNYHLNVALYGHIQGERFSSTYGYADGFSQWDLNTRHTITLRQCVIEPGFGIENIFDKVDNSYWSSNFSTINPGRSFYISLALKFKN